MDYEETILEWRETARPERHAVAQQTSHGVTCPSGRSRVMVGLDHAIKGQTARQDNTLRQAATKGR